MASFSSAPMPASTANWHWKNKNVSPWARTWFEQELTNISVKGDGEEFVSISSVSDVDGDVELGQRKSKYAYFVSYTALWSNWVLNRGYSAVQTNYHIRCQDRIEVEWQDVGREGCFRDSHDS
jgi:activator of HSP90 ATPase